MGKQEAVLLLLIVFASARGISQEVSSEVTVPAASLITAGGIDFAQTVGEAAVQLLSSDDYDLTEGFQQPRIIYIPGTKPEGTGVNAYPNPVSDYLTIELFGETARIFTVTIVNVYGAVIYSTELSFTGPYWYKMQKSMSDLSQGLYLVRVTSRDRFVMRTIKIEKL